MDDRVKEERLKAALWYNTGKTVDCIALDKSINATPHFIGGLSEMIYAQVEMITRDLEDFAKHAGRTTIRTEDVLLLARRNESLQDIMKRAAKSLEEQK